MKILETRQLALPEVHLLRFQRFCDERGYFTETYRRADFDALAFLSGVDFLQCNESHSKKGVVRGLHFQWNPYMGKLVRTIHGHMIDLVLDVRKGSPRFGSAIAIDMPGGAGRESDQWIWIPAGFAHGSAFLEATTIEYFCSGTWNRECEISISPTAPDLDWSASDPEALAAFRRIAAAPVMSGKDRDGLTLDAWARDERSRHFLYGRC